MYGESAAIGGTHRFHHSKEERRHHLPPLVESAVKGVSAATQLKTSNNDDIGGGRVDMAGQVSPPAVYRPETRLRVSVDSVRV